MVGEEFRGPSGGDGSGSEITKVKNTTSTITYLSAATSLIERLDNLKGALNMHQKLCNNVKQSVKPVFYYYRDNLISKDSDSPLKATQL